MMGPTKSGKSFFVDRLRHTLRGDWQVTRDAWAPAPVGTTIDSTSEVIAYAFDRRSARASRLGFTLFDIPGEAFGRAMSEPTSAENREFFRNMLTILAFCDVVVFVASALRLLARDGYVTKGGEQDGELPESSRRERVAILRAFASNLGALQPFVQPLRDRLAARQLKVDEGLFENTLDAVTASQGTAGRKGGRLRLGAIMLLAQADEYRRCAAPPDIFDADPVTALLSAPEGLELLGALRDGFEQVCVDFCTSEDAVAPAAVDPQGRHYGVSGVHAEWMGRVLRDVRRPLPLRVLQRSHFAMAWRRLLDPGFDALMRL
jgi:hypothetical protein